MLDLARRGSLLFPILDGMLLDGLPKELALNKVAIVHVLLAEFELGWAILTEELKNIISFILNLLANLTALIIVLTNSKGLTSSIVRWIVLQALLVDIHKGGVLCIILLLHISLLLQEVKKEVGILKKMKQAAHNTEYRYREVKVITIYLEHIAAPLNAKILCLLPTNYRRIRIQ